MPKKGEAPTEAQRAALMRGQQRRREVLAKGGESARDRWAKLLDGTLTVADLDDDEIKRMQVKGKGGSFAGRRPAIPSHLAKQFRDENVKRALALFRGSLVEAVEGMLEIARTAEKDETRLKAYDTVINRVLGKTPETVRVINESQFEDMMSDAVLDRDMSDIEAEQHD